MSLAFNPRISWKLPFQQTKKKPFVIGYLFGFVQRDLEQRTKLIYWQIQNAEVLTLPLTLLQNFSHSFFQWLLPQTHSSGPYYLVRDVLIPLLTPICLRKFTFKNKRFIYWKGTFTEWKRDRLGHSPSRSNEARNLLWSATWVQRPRDLDKPLLLSQATSRPGNYVSTPKECQHHRHRLS